MTDGEAMVGELAQVETATLTSGERVAWCCGVIEGVRERRQRDMQCSTVVEGVWER